MKPSCAPLRISASGACVEFEVIDRRIERAQHSVGHAGGEGVTHLTSLRRGAVNEVASGGECSLPESRSSHGDSGNVWLANHEVGATPVLRDAIRAMSSA